MRSYRPFLLLLIGVVFISQNLFSASVSEDEKPYHIMVLWDASINLNEKNLDKELEFLSTYFKQLGKARVTAVLFSDQLIDTKTYTIEKGGTEELRSFLKSSVYDGYPNIPQEFLKKEKLTQQYLLFTNGISYGDEIYDQFAKPVHTINSSKYCNRARLHNLSYYTFGRFLNLHEQSVSEAIELLKPENVLINRYVETKEVNSSKNLVKGVVTDANGPLSDVAVWSKKRSLGAITNGQGEYNIIASTGDTLTFSYLNKKTVTVAVGAEKEINVVMRASSTSLDEVVIKAENNEEDPPEYVITAYGKKRKESVGVAVQTVTGKEIIKGSATLTQALQGKLQGIRLEDPTNIASAIVRDTRTIPLSIQGSTGDGGQPLLGKELISQYPAFFLDGIPLPRYSKDNKVRHDFINPEQIKDVTVLKGLAATNRYGTYGASGVILITTTTGDAGGFVQKEEKKFTAPSLDKYTGSLELIEERELSNLGKQILDADGQPDYQSYLELRKSKGTDLAYYIEASKAFTKVGDKATALRVLSNIQAAFPENTSALRTLIYQYRMFGEYDRILNVQKQILAISPTEIQNYRDLAKAYGDAGKHREAIDAYRKLLSGKANWDLNFDPQYKANVISFKNLLRNRNQRWQTSHLDKQYLTPAIFDLRVELHWSGYDARFKLNIVKPNKELLYWAYDDSNEVDLNRSINSGITSKELNFLKAEKGTWYFGLEGVPTSADTENNYLEVTVFSNYGTAKEKRIIKVLKIETDQNGKMFAKMELD